jgi:hypothetical protein
VTASNKNLIEFRGEESTLDEDFRLKLAERAAASSALSRATQLRAILLYVVRQAILQPEEPIHESEIAHRVLGRRMDFNPLDDNIVRVQMAHLRKKLDLYFSSEGKHEEVVITIALGTYKPVFSSRSQPVPATEQLLECTLNPGEDPVSVDGGVAEDSGSEAQDATPGPQSPYVRRRSVVFGAVAGGLAMLVLAGCCIALWVQNRAAQASIDAMQRSFYPWKYTPSMAAFWSGFIDSNRGTDVVMSDAFFKLAQDMSKKSFTLNDYLSRGYIRQLLSEEKSPDTREVLGKVSTWSSANANHLNLAWRILALDPLGNKVHLYFARDYRPDLIDQDNVILLGSRITNPWEYVFDGRLNFAVKPDSNGLTTIVNRAPATGEQAVFTRSDSVGYCVVAYMPNPGNNGKVLLIEGTSVEATEAGGDFLLSEDRMSNFQKRLNSKKFPYFEALLKTSQVNGTPFTATVEAYRTYPNLH